MGNVAADEANAGIVRSLQCIGSCFVSVHVEYRGKVEMWKSKCFAKLGFQREIECMSVEL